MTTPTTPPSILIVDDSPDAADSLATIFRAHGHEARTAYSSSDVGRLVQAGFRPGVVAMDIGLPDTDGYAVARELCAALGYRPLLLAVTGHQNLDDRSDREGFDWHFLKPVDPTLLLKMLDIYGRRRRYGEDPAPGELVGLRRRGA
jgi:DNA-binding response OmpR family regulator